MATNNLLNVQLFPPVFFILILTKFPIVVPSSNVQLAVSPRFLSAGQSCEPVSPKSPIRVKK